MAFSSTPSFKRCITTMHDTPNIRGVFHFSFTVSDIERSLIWYRDVLGLELVHRQRQDNAYTKTLVGLPDAALEVAQFRIPGVEPEMSSHVLELVEYISPRGETVPLRPRDVGGAHMCFVVPNAETEYRRLMRHGVLFYNPPVEITEGINRGGRACYFLDPDGITLELHEPPPARVKELGLPVRDEDAQSAAASGIARADAAS